VSFERAECREQNSTSQEQSRYLRSNTKGNTNERDNTSAYPVATSSVSAPLLMFTSKRVNEATGSLNVNTTGKGATDERGNADD
jgi:hypothetical protein